MAHSMNRVIDNLWIGDLRSALDVATLKAHNISSVLTAMRGRISINETFVRLQINLDDTEDADILGHLVTAISFIEARLERGKGVLVHCQAGMSRSVTIVAAYLMYVQHLNPESALGLIRKVRPNVQPNPGFLRQLEIFYEASYKVSRRDKATRMFYLERVVQDVMNGDGTVETDFFARYPRTPTDSAPPTPVGRRRKIRCKMCRQELATREHMLDHGQVGPPTPASAAAISPAVSRRPSMHDGRPYNPFSPMSPSTSRRPSMHDGNPMSALAPLSPSSPSTSRRPSAHEPANRTRLGSNTDTRPLKSSLLAMGEAMQLGKDISDSLSESALEEEDSGEDKPDGEGHTVKTRAAQGTRPSLPRLSSALSECALEDDDWLEVKPETEDEKGTEEKSKEEFLSSSPLTASSSEPLPAISPLIARRLSQSSGLMHGSDLAAQLYANPKLAALRSPSGLNLTAIASSPSSPNAAKSLSYTSPPLLANPKCSGYFVEPMKWMDSFLEEGHLAGKIVCPNKKCGAKLGNYDWAGVCCACREWVVPGFCIHRSKVDEIM